MFLRSVFAAYFLLFVFYMFQTLALNWGMSLLGFIAGGMFPIPFLKTDHSRNLGSIYLARS